MMDGDLEEWYKRFPLQAMDDYHPRFFLRFGLFTHQKIGNFLKEIRVDRSLSYSIHTFLTEPPDFLSCRYNKSH